MKREKNSLSLSKKSSERIVPAAVLSTTTTTTTTTTNTTTTAAADADGTRAAAPAENNDSGKVPSADEDDDDFEIASLNGFGEDDVMDARKRKCTEAEAAALACNQKIKELQGDLLSMVIA